MIRKKGKLPPECHSREYGLEYGLDTLELPRSFGPGNDVVRNVVIIDDLLATGGTMCAAVDLLHAAGSKVVEASVVMELTSLTGRARVAEKAVSVHSLLKYNDI